MSTTLIQRGAELPVKTTFSVSSKNFPQKWLTIFFALFFVFSGSVFATSLEFNPEIEDTFDSSPAPNATSSGNLSGIFGNVDLNNFLTDKNYGNTFFNSNGILMQMITGLATWLLRLIGALFVIMIMYGGYQYIFGAVAGKGEGKQTVIYAVTGLTVAIFAVVLVSLTMGLVGGEVPKELRAPTVEKAAIPISIPSVTNKGIGNFVDSSNFINNTSLSRVERHRNPTAFTTDIAKQVGLVAGVDYIQGAPFPANEGGDRYHTAYLLGDPYDTTIKVIDKIGLINDEGKSRWDGIKK